MAETCSLVYRLEERYLDEDADLLDQGVILTNFSTSPCKLASTSGLEFMVLNHMQISHIGDVSRFANLVSHVMEADLAWNSISDWKVVSTILTHLPLLRTFNLSHNPLARDIADVEIPTMKYMRMFVLNGTQLSASSLKQLFAKMPNLYELHLSENDECDFLAGGEDLSPISESVKTVHLNRCGLRSWQQVERALCRFPSRKTVFLVDNPINSVKRELPVKEFITLSKLNLSKTNITNWESIDNLAEFPALVDLRITNVPLLDELEEEERHHLVISRMQNLSTLNGSTVTPDLRETSERFFIRYYQERPEKPAHYERLVEKHGQLEKLVKVDLTPKSTCSVHVVCEESNYSGKLSINLHKTVGDFIKFLEKPTGIRVGRIRLFHSNSDGYTEECRFPNLSLFSLRVEDGDTFKVVSKVVASRRRPLSNTSPLPS